MALWSYPCGEKSVNRVRVYERSVSPVLYVEWYFRGKRYQKALRYEGYAVTDKRLAMQIAHKMAAELKADRNRAARRIVFGPPTTEKTLLELAQAFHMAKEADWSPKQIKTQRRFRDFWLEQLGEHSILTEINPAEVQHVGRKIEASAETRKKYLRWIKQAYRYAERKLRWVDAGHDMRNVDLPKVRSESRSYTLEEVRGLLSALEAIDSRAGWLGHVAWQSGRRLTAIRTLPKSAVTVHAKHSVLRFPGETDKARQSGEVVVVGRAHELTRELMARPGERMLDVTEHMCIKVWLPEAESRAGIEHVAGRAWHGIKRRFATESQGHRGRDKQSGTRADTLDGRYVQDDLAPKLTLAQHLSDAGTVSKAGKSVDAEVSG